MKIKLCQAVISITLIAIFIAGHVRGQENPQSLFLPAIHQSSSNGQIAITDIIDNRSNYPSSAIPLYEKIEITFQVSGTGAINPQFPYDGAPPNGIDTDYDRYNGISVDALFTPDNWQTVYQQPAFYYQYFEDEIRTDLNGIDRNWVYPLDQYAWKVRFSPNQTGTWQFKLTAIDASGQAESTPQTFEVINSPSHGFIKVSQNDPRYFEFDDGYPFIPLGFQGKGKYNYPTIGEEPFPTYAQNGINFIRIWMSGLYGASWLEWVGGRNLYDGYLPRPGIVPFYDSVRDQSTMTQIIDYEFDGDSGWFDGCRMQFFNHPESVKPNTTYRLRIKYQGESILGPRNSTNPDYGLVGKIGNDWDENCFESGLNTVVSNYGSNTSDWTYLEGTWTSGTDNFLPRIYLALENVSEGYVYIDSISLKEEFGDGDYGPEILVEPSMEYELYYPEQSAYAMDKFVEGAEKYGVYLKLVIQEKNDKIFVKINDDGTYIFDGEDNSDGFYGIGRQKNKTRWLQEAWWRYLQARWGYSTAIHSWELTNEGDPWDSDHWALTDELGKFMHCRTFGIDVGSENGDTCTSIHPNSHLVTTSFWHSFPAEAFWANPSFPNVDYADLHAYVSTGWLDDPAYETDAALFHLDYSQDARSSLDWYSNANGTPTKPIIRGETGIDYLDEQTENPDLSLDQHGVWLHNLIWSGLDPGAMTELYWWEEVLFHQPGPDNQEGLFEVFLYFRQFLADIPLTNGFYQDVEAVLSDPGMRPTGQKDLTHNRAHLWVQNKAHTWRNVVDGTGNISGLRGIVTIAGFSPNKTLAVTWHEFTTNGIPTVRHSSITTDSTGTIIIDLPANQDITDIGIKIGDY